VHKEELVVGAVFSEAVSRRIPCYQGRVESVPFFIDAALVPITDIKPFNMTIDILILTC
jgi:hypothetical protein